MPKSEFATATCAVRKATDEVIAHFESKSGSMLHETIWSPGFTVRAVFEDSRSNRAGSAVWIHMNPLREVQVNKLRTHTHTVTLVAWSVCMHVVVPHRARNRRKNLTLSQQGMEAGCLQVPHPPVPTCSNDFQCETSVTRRIQHCASAKGNTCWNRTRTRQLSSIWGS
jgi:hypothetical protein